jgi:hypothetical protein
MHLKETIHYWITTLVMLAVAILEVPLSFMVARHAKPAPILFFVAFVTVVTYLILGLEVLRDIVQKINRLALLFFTLLQINIYFAIQYGLLERLSPGSIDGFDGSISDLFYQSTLVSVFNPLIVPHDSWGHAFIMLHMYSMVIFVVFLLQNISLFNHKKVQ